MRLVCPGCGGEFSAEAWANDASIRESLYLVSQMPPGVGQWIFHYLKLFRPRIRTNLAWHKVVRLLGELDDEIRAPTLVWGTGGTIANNPQAWADAMRHILNHPPKQLPLKTHNYLKAIAYQMAQQQKENKETKKKEKQNHDSNTELDEALSRFGG